ncbi:MAG: hypothetical protein ACI4EN_07185 [Butyrivibrio sp.]
MKNTALSAQENMMFPGNQFSFNGRGRHWQACRRIPERSKMLKIRLQGTRNDIKWFDKILQRHPKVEVTEQSELYQNKGTNKYYRQYVEVKKSNIKEK